MVIEFARYRVMKDIMCITSAHYSTVNKQQDSVALNVWQRVCTFTIRLIIFILWIGKKLSSNLRINTKLLRKSVLRQIFKKLIKSFRINLKGVLKDRKIVNGLYEVYWETNIKYNIRGRLRKVRWLFMLYRS